MERKEKKGGGKGKGKKSNEQEKKKMEKLLTNPSVMRVITIGNSHVKIKLPSVV